MNFLPPEIITHVMRFLSVSDRKEAALVCKKWYHASLDPLLQEDIIVKLVIPEGGNFTANFVQRKLSHLALADWDSSNGSITTILRSCPSVYEDLKTISLRGCDISEAMFVTLLSHCTKLVELDLCRCNSIFLSGKLLENQNDINDLKSALVNVKVLNLSCLRHLTDVSFKRLVSVMKNIEEISFASTNIMFGTDSYGSKDNTAVFQFRTLLNFIQERAPKIKHLDMGYLPLREQNVEKLSSVRGLQLEEIILKGCTDLTDQSIILLAQNQPSLQMIDISGCKDLGQSKNLLRVFVENLPKLRTLNARKCLRIGLSEVKYLAGLNCLRSLDLGDCMGLVDNDLITGLCGKTKNLLSVNLRCCEALGDKFVHHFCRTNRNLVSLDLSSCIKLTDQSMQEVSKNLTCLRSLKLAYCREISDLGLIGYMPENGVPTLHTSLECDHDTCKCIRKPESKIFNKPKGLKEKHLSNISEAQAKLEAGEETCKLSNLTYIQVLDLSSCSRITDLGVTEAIRFVGLQSLSLNMVKELTNQAVAMVARNNPSLEEVNVKGCTNLSDSAVNSLLTHCPRLRRLDVSQCDLITDECLKMLASRGRKLTHLDVSFCAGLSLEAVKGLEKTLPRLKVSCRPMLF